MDVDYRNPLRSTGGQPGDPGGLYPLRWLWFVLAPLIWGVPVILLIVALGLLSLILLPSATMVLSPLAGLVLALFLVISLRAAVEARRQRNAAIIVRYLDAAVRLNLPLAAFLDAAERSERGARRRQIRQLRLNLLAGDTLAQAVVSAGDIPSQTAAVIAAHEPMGRVAFGLEQLMEQQRRREIDQPRRTERRYYYVYTLFLFLTVFTFVTAFMIFVMPKFREIFRDFRTDLPPATEFLIATSSIIGDDLGWLVTLAAIAFVLLLIFLISLILQDIFLRVMPLPRVRPLLDWLLWRLPLLHGIEQNRGMAETCALLATASRSGIPLVTAVQRATVLPVNPDFRRKLVDFRQALESGQPASAAAVQSGLPDLFSGLLTSAGDTAQADMFAFLARHYRQRFSRTLTALQAAIEPFLVLCAGGVVAFVVLALFLPLIKLIQSVSGLEGGLL